MTNPTRAVISKNPKCDLNSEDIWQKSKYAKLLVSSLKMPTFFLSLLINFINCINSDDIEQREIDTYWKYYYEENDTSAFRFGTNPSIDRESIITKVKRKILGSDLLNEYYPDWMAQIYNSRRLDTITIPGTHDTCARVGGPLFKCQDRSLEEQLLMGVRLLDIRCRHINNVFMIHHERIFQDLAFGGGVRNVCVKFLQEHPSEVIFMMIKEEWNAKSNSRTFDATMYDYINCSEYKDYFYLYEGNFPPIEQVRGKIILLRRFHKDTLKNIDLGNYIEFANNDHFVSDYTITTYGQDCFKVYTLFDRPKKFKQVQKNFALAKVFPKQITADTKSTIFLNYASGQSLGCYPYLVAEYLTPAVGKHAEVEYPEDFLGMILFDMINRYYPKIIYNILKRNFIPEENGGLPNTFELCGPDVCTNTAQGTNQVIVALVALSVVVFVIIIVVVIVLCIRRKRNKVNEHPLLNEPLEASV